MADFQAQQRVALHNGTEAKAFDVTKPIYVALSDGTENALIDASGNVQVILAANDGVDIGNVDVASVPAPLNVIGGGTEATALRVTIANDSTGVVTVDDGGTSLTVDGSVTVSATQLDIDSLNKNDDEVLVWANTAKDGTGTDYVPIVDADGKLIISNPAGTEYTEDAATPAAATGTAIVVERDDALGGITPVEGDWSTLFCDANGALWVKHNGDVTISDGGNTITVDGTVGISGSVTVTATDLDIRALDHVTIGDSVRIGDGTETWSIDASGYGQVDIAAQSLTAVKVSKDANANSETNPIYVQVVSTAVSAQEIHDYDTAASVAKGATDNHDYTVANTTFLLKRVMASASGSMKIEVQVGPVASLATKAVKFSSGANRNVEFVFDPPIEVPATSTGTVRVIRKNDDDQAMDVYSTIIGNDV